MYRAFRLAASGVTALAAWLPAQMTGSAGPGPPPQQGNGLVVVSLQGASLERARALAGAARLPNLSGLARRGSGIAATIPVDAPATATARATFETGAAPSAHGIVANSFHVRGDSITRTRSGFNTAFHSEALYEAAARQGRTVATVGINSVPRGQALAARITAGRVLRAARMVRLSNARASDTTVAALPNGAARIILSTSQGAPTAIVQFADGGDTIVALRPGEWIPLWLTRTSPRVGTWLKLLERPGEDGTTRIYLGAAVATDATPASMASALEMRGGPAPATPDYGHHAAGEIDDATWREQVIREANYLTLAAEQVRDALRPTLLMLALNLLDAHEHQFLRTDPRHPMFGRADAALQVRWRTWIEEAYGEADAMVGRVASGARNVVVASEYALLPVHSRYQLAAALRNLGYRVTGDSADLRVLASSASAQIRLNVRGREPTGTVEDSTAMVDRLMSHLHALRDPRTGAPVIARVETSASMRQRADHSAAFGDLRVIAHPGYALGDAATAGDVIDVPFLPGEHAFDPRLPATHGLFISAGRDVSARPLDSVQATDVAVIAAALLRIDPPRGSTGRPRR